MGLHRSSAGIHTRPRENDLSSCRLFNPLKVVRWNSHKRYLFDLEKWGVATVPTYSFSVSAAASLERVFDKRGWEWSILKAAVGAGASDVHRVRSGEIAENLAQLLGENERTEYLVQPFVEPVKTEGEWSFIFFKGDRSHVLLKKPALDDYRAHGIYGGTVESAVPDPADRAQAHSIISRLPFDLLFARLDLVRVAGRLAIIELELIEPILYFNVIPEAIDRLVGATLRSLGGNDSLRSLLM